MDTLTGVAGKNFFVHSEEGSATLEFAVAVPVVLLFLVGSMITMVGLLSYGNATYATGLAARYASLHGSTSAMPATAQVVTSQVLGRIWNGGQGVQVSTVWSAGNVPGSTVSVTTLFVLPLAIPMTSVHQLTITASSVRVITR